MKFFLTNEQQSNIDVRTAGWRYAIITRMQTPQLLRSAFYFHQQQQRTSEGRAKYDFIISPGNISQQQTFASTFPNPGLSTLSGRVSAFLRPKPVRRFVNYYRICNGKWQELSAGEGPWCLARTSGAPDRTRHRSPRRPFRSGPVLTLALHRGAPFSVRALERNAV